MCNPPKSVEWKVAEEGAMMKKESPSLGSILGGAEEGGVRSGQLCESELRGEVGRSVSRSKEGTDTT